MRQEVFYKNLEPAFSIKNYLERQIKRIERRILKFPEDQVFLHVTLEKHPRKEEYVALFTLSLPKRQLHAEEQGKNLRHILKEVCGDLIEQLEGVKSKLRREEVYKRKRAKFQVQEPVPGMAPYEKTYEAKALTDLILPQLKKLYNFVRREIIYHQLIGDIEPYDLTITDIVDETVLFAVRNFDQKLDSFPLDRWLYRIALDILEREVEEIKAEREARVPVETEIPEPEPTEAISTLGSEILDFWQPDETLKLEDLVPDDKMPTPEEILTRQEIQKYIHQTLSQLPKGWRESFILYSVEGFSLEEVAWVRRKSVDEVRKEIQSAREFLQAKLEETELV